MPRFCAALSDEITLGRYHLIGGMLTKFSHDQHPPSASILAAVEEKTS
jgi:hypothetical protein